MQATRSNQNRSEQLPAMALVLGAVAEQVPMELADHVFRDRALLKGIEHLIHDVGVSGDFLLVAGFELGEPRGIR